MEIDLPLTPANQLGAPDPQNDQPLRSAGTPQHWHEAGYPMVYATIETPRGSRNKYKYDPKLHGIRLSKVLPAGMIFPYDFGFIPNTRGEDGDPLDVLVLMDAPTFPGCIVRCRLVGIIRAEQAELGKRVRNDRLIAVATDARDYSHIRRLKDLNHHLLSEIKCFFLAYNAAYSREFVITGQKGRKAAKALLYRSSERGDSTHSWRHGPTSCPTPVASTGEDQKQQLSNPEKRIPESPSLLTKGTMRRALAIDEQSYGPEHADAAIHRAW
jgi:inorganic pyrophosphatase